MEPIKIPFLYNFSPVIVPRPHDWAEWIHITGAFIHLLCSPNNIFICLKGYWFLDDADVGSKKWDPPQDLLDFIDRARNAGKKIVYIGFASIMEVYTS